MPGLDDILWTADNTMNGITILVRDYMPGCVTVLRHEKDVASIYDISSDNDNVPTFQLHYRTHRGEIKWMTLSGEDVTAFHLFVIWKDL
jgi:hypothetical protein